MNKLIHSIKNKKKIFLVLFIITFFLTIVYNKLFKNSSRPFDIFFFFFIPLCALSFIYIILKKNRQDK